MRQSSKPQVVQAIDPVWDRMRKEADRWRIIDIFMHGTVSELALRRAEYSSALERDGLDKVVQSLLGQAAKLSSGADAEGQ